jgi:DNA-binding XRE family transcriptional regulator
VGLHQKRARFYHRGGERKFQFITHTLRCFCQFLAVRRNLDKQLAIFLRKKRGNLSFAEFAKKAGISHQTLFRIEHGEHHLTLDKLETVLGKLNIRLKDIFPGEF